MGIMVFLVWVILCVLVGVYANGKGRSGIGLFFVSVVLSPLIGFIIAAVMSKNVEKLEEQAVEAGTQRKCPFCAEIVKAEAKVCKHCGKDLPELTKPSISKEIVENEDGTFTVLGRTFKTRADAEALLQLAKNKR